MGDFSAHCADQQKHQTPAWGRHWAREDQWGVRFIDKGQHTEKSDKGHRHMELR